jgi:hypothetical protein
MWKWLAAATVAALGAWAFARAKGSAKAQGSKAMQTSAYIITYWETISSENHPAIASAVQTAAQQTGWQDRVGAEIVAPGDLVIVHGVLYNVNEVALVQSALSPVQPAASCRHYVIGAKFEGGDPQSNVSNYNEAIGDAGRTALLDWLDVWYPAKRAAVAAAITALSTHLEAGTAVGLTQNPTMPALNGS